MKKQEGENSSSEENNEEMHEHYNFKVDAGQEMLRIDKFLLEKMPKTSRSKIQQAAKNGNILVNDEKVKQNYKVKPRDEISIVLPFPVRELRLIPEDIPLDILHEDDELIVVQKKANMVVHPGYGNYTGTLVNALVHHFDNLPERSQDYFGRPGIVHRLDKHTTGVLVVAKTEYALNFLAKQFHDRTTDRRYWALVWGNVEEDGAVEGNIGRSLKNRKVFTVFPEGEHGKSAKTHYKIIERFGLVTLVECKLETGRTHQIRVHMKHIGHPLFHDLEYGGDRILRGTRHAKYKTFVENCFAKLEGQALHAKTLGFKHPTSKQQMQFDSDLPKGFSEVLEKWRTYTKALRTDNS